MSCCFSVAQSCPTPCDPTDCSTPGFPVHHHLLELAQTYVHWVTDAIQPSRSLSSPSPPAVFSNELALHIRWPKYWSFSFSISPSNEYSSLITFRINWFYLSPLSPRDSQESSPTWQFETINSLMLSLLYSPTLFPGGASGKQPTCQCRRPKRLGFDLRVAKILWTRKWQPTPVLLSGEFHGQRSLQSIGLQRFRHDWSNLAHMHTHIHTWPLGKP